MVATSIGVLISVLVVISDILIPGSAYFSVFKWEFYGRHAIFLTLFLFPVWWAFIMGTVAGLLTYPLMLVWWHFSKGFSLRCEEQKV
jgi:hypothetical protein